MDVQDEYVDTQWIAARWKISLVSARAWMKRGGIPYMKVMKRYRVPMRAVLEFEQRELHMK